MTACVAPVLAVSHTHTRLIRRHLITRGKIIATYDIEEMIVRSTKLLPVCCAICTLLIVIVATVPVSGGATSKEMLQDLTPFVPNPSECTIEPRPAPSPPAKSELSGSDTLEATPDPNAPSVDEETVGKITAVVRGAIACSNAGDILRALAFFTDFYVDNMFTDPDGVDYEGFLQYLSTPPAAVEPDKQVALIDISEFQFVDDGVVTAVVVSGDPENPFIDSLLFVESEGGWLIAGWQEESKDTATPGP
jgi:hypothetical protein